VKIDGLDIRKYTLQSLREQMSFVLQDTVLFRVPIWQNIAYGKPEAQRDDVAYRLPIVATFHPTAGMT